jgi:hypothetical protein
MYIHLDRVLDMTRTSRAQTCKLFFEDGSERTGTHIYHQLIDGHQKGSARRPSRRFRSPICSLLADRELAAANKPHESDAAPLNSVFLPPIIRSAVAFGMEHTRSSGTNQPGHLLRLCARPALGQVQTPQRTPRAQLQLFLAARRCSGCQCLPFIFRSPASSFRR